VSAEAVSRDGAAADPPADRRSERARLFATGARFLVSGAINTAVGFVIFRVLLVLYGALPGAIAAAQATAYAVGIVISYVMNRRWTFRSEHGHQLPRFLIAHLGALVLSSALLQGGVSLLHLPLMLCFVLVAGITTVMNFVAQRYWVFAPR
jgi:putative flippase GtrA